MIKSFQIRSELYSIHHFIQYTGYRFGLNLKWFLNALFFQDINDRWHYAEFCKTQISDVPKNLPCFATKRPLYYMSRGRFSSKLFDCGLKSYIRVTEPITSPVGSNIRSNIQSSAAGPFMYSPNPQISKLSPGERSPLISKSQK